MLRAFLLTVALETLLALALGVRGKKNTAVVVLAQAVTNPPLVITLMLISMRCGFVFYCCCVAGHDHDVGHRARRTRHTSGHQRADAVER